MIAEPIASARSAQVLPESRIRPGIVALFRLVSPLYFHALLGFRSVAVRHAERLVQSYADFFDGKTRLLLAFRHPYGDEAQLMGYLIGKILDKEAISRGVRFAKSPHAHFVHGYEVPLWAGAFERWILPRVGAVPVYHTKFDGKSIRRIRSLMKDGAYPVAIAPEGQVSYSSEELPRLESGAAHICAWCAEDLAKAGRRESLVILPISVHYRWNAAAARRLDGLIRRIESECGIKPPDSATRFDRLSAAAGSILAAAERHYTLFCGASLPRPGNPTRAERLGDLREAALTAAEGVFHLRPEGDAVRRVYKIRQTGWDRIFRADLPDMDSLPRIERALADRVAGEAWYASRHMELVDLAYYLDFDRLKENDPLELYIETAQNYFDLVSRLGGGNISNRINIRGKSATVIIGEPIAATDRLSSQGLTRKAAIDSLSGDLRRAYADCIAEIREDRKNG